MNGGEIERLHLRVEREIPRALMPHKATEGTESVMCFAIHEWTQHVERDISWPLRLPGVQQKWNESGVFGREQIEVHVHQKHSGQFDGVE